MTFIPDARISSSQTRIWTAVKACLLSEHLNVHRIDTKIAWKRTVTVLENLEEVTSWELKHRGQIFALRLSFSCVNVHESPVNICTKMSGCKSTGSCFYSTSIQAIIVGFSVPVNHLVHVACLLNKMDTNWLISHKKVLAFPTDSLHSWPLVRVKLFNKRQFILTNLSELND